MLSTNSANVSPNLSSVQTGSPPNSKKSPESGYVKLPIPALDFQLQIVQSAQPVDEVTIDAPAEVATGPVSSDSSREQLRTNATLPRSSRPVSDPPVSQTPETFPSLDIASEPENVSKTSELPAEAPAPEVKQVKTSSAPVDDLKLSPVAQDQERQAVQADQKLLAQQVSKEAVTTERHQRLQSQHQEQNEAQQAAYDGNSGPQPFNQLV